MPLYGGDGGVSFSGKQFADVIKRNEEYAKKEDKFSKFLLGAKAGANFFTNVINEKADMLEANNIVARAHWLDVNKSSENWKKDIDEYNKLGYSRQQMLETEYTNLLRNKLAEIYPDYDVSGYNDMIANLSREYAAKPENLAAWNKVVDSQLALPSLSQEEVIEQIQKEGRAPRTIGSWFGNTITKFVKSHNENTLNQEDKKAKEKAIGSLLGTRYDNARDALKEFANAGNPIDDLVTFMKSEEGKQITVFKNAKVDFTSLPKIDKFGNETNVVYASSVGVGLGGEPVVLGRPIVMFSATKEARRKDYTPTQLQLGGGVIKNFVTEKNDPFLIEAYKEAVKDDTNELGFVYTVLATRDNIMKNLGVESETTATALATEFILNQDNPSGIKDINMSLYDLEKIKQTVDTRNINDYILSINSVKDEYERKAELTIMRDEILSSIKEADIDEQTKQEEIAALNIIMKDNGIVPAEELNEIIIENLENPEEQSFLKQLNEAPYIGRVSDFMFGEELDIWDATWLIPFGGPILKIGGKVATKTILPKLTQKVLSSKAGQQAFTKISNRIQKGFQNDNVKEKFINSLNPFEKVMYNSISASGKSIDTTKFGFGLLTMPGTYVMGLLPDSYKGKVAWGLGASLFGYNQYQNYKYATEKTKD